MSFVEQILVIMAVFTVVALGAAAVAFFIGRRMLRRRWHGVRNHVATKSVLATVAVVDGWRERNGAKLTPHAASVGTATRTRRRMWCAIEDAEAAVDHANASHAPVAELPAVCRSLRSVADQLDTMLRLERRLPLASGARPDALRTQVADVITAARDVQSAALGASSDATQPRVTSLVRDARHEVELVTAAVARMRSISPT